MIKDGNAPVIRVNQPQGEPAYLPLTVFDWHYHQNGADIAVASLDVTDIAAYAIDTRSFVTESFCRLAGINLGSEVYMLGRFVHHAGTGKNMPTARSGIISAMPDPNELIPMAEGIKPQEAYLVEMRSLSGFSGSPTFYNLFGADIVDTVEVLMAKRYKFHRRRKTSLIAPINVFD